MRTTGNGSRRGLGDSLRPSMPREPMKSKVVLLGDGGVGKTSLVRRFVVDQYSDDYITTIGTKVSKRSLNLGSPLAEVEMVLQIWDVLGQKGYSGVQETAIKGAQGVLLVYDATNDESRRALEDYWIPAVWRLAGRIPTVFAGNKSDLVPAGLDVRAPTTDAIRTLIERLAVVEQDFKGPEEVLSNRERRLEWLDGIDA